MGDSNNFDILAALIVVTATIFATALYTVQPNSVLFNLLIAIS
jgi:hypothetical protein